MRSCFRLTPFSSDNAETVLEWRNKARVRHSMIDDSLISETQHQRFLEALQSDPTRAYYIVELGGHPVGALYFTGIGQPEVTWGCYIGVDGVIPGLFPAMMLMAARHAFSTPETLTLRSDVATHNSAPLKLNRYLGLEPTARRRIRTRMGKIIELVEFKLTRKDFEGVAAKARTIMPASIRQASNEFELEY